NGHYRVKAITEIADFNEVLGAEFSNENYDTVGGLVLNKFGRLPKRGESVVIGSLKFMVLRADSRRLHTVLVEESKCED
ncbi:MAG: transporter associated domain-containing protein, partial [Nitrosomonadaceae bacterium]